MGLQSGDYSLIAIGIGIFCLAISTYQNVWKFYINESFLSNKKGLLIFSKTEKYSFSEVSSLIIEKYNRAGRSSEYTEISIQFKDGQRAIIESDKTKRLKDEIETAQRLQEIIAYASWTNILSMSKIVYSFEEQNNQHTKRKWKSNIACFYQKIIGTM